MKFAQEIAWLVREHGVELINLADENPTSSRKAWLAFLEFALVAENVEVTIIGSTRADDIVRDAALFAPVSQGWPFCGFFWAWRALMRRRLACDPKGRDAVEGLAEAIQLFKVPME